MKKKFFLRNLVRFTVPLLIPIIILGSFSIIITQSYIKHQINTSNAKMLEQTRSVVEMMFNEMDTLHYTMNLNSNLISSLKSILRSENINRGDLGAYSTFMNLLNPFSNIKTYVYSIYLYFDNDKGNFLASNEGMTSTRYYYDTSWYDRLSDIGSEELYMEERSVKRFSFDRHTNEILTVYRKFQSPGSTKTVGHIIMNIKRADLDKRMMELRYLPHQSIYLLNQDGAPIASSVPRPAGNERTLADTYQEALTNKENIVTSIGSSKYPVRYVSITPKTYFYSLPIRLLYLTFGLLAVSLLLGIALAYYISKRNLQNLDTVIQTLDHAEKGLDIPEMPEKITDEYSYILQGIVKSFIEQSYLKIQLSEKKYRLKTMEMMALQSNINPHFMANTLRTIFWKSMDLTGGQNDVSRMLDYLAEVVHYSITDSNKTVLLEEEIYHTNNYVEILKIRYRDKFLFQWDYDEELIRYRAMKLILQPLVENAVYHGIKEAGHFGYIRVKIVPKDQWLRITVTDTGIGMKRERLKVLREALTADEQQNHIGVFNTFKRLQLMYGEEQSFVIRSKYGFGTMVEVLVPMEDK
jgi:two-component system sensor histidine kinase YesM